MKPRGILLIGLNGCGKSTLTRLLAQRLSLRPMDVEDYYFPKDQAVPFSVSLRHDEVQALLARDIRESSAFVLCSVRADWCEEITRACALAVWLKAPAALRQARIRQRDILRFGNRVAPGGDLHESQERFYAMAAARSEDSVRQSALRLPCPLLELDAVRPPDSLALEIENRYLALTHTIPPKE